MSATPTVPVVQPVSTRQLWTGRLLTAWAGLFLLVDAVMKVARMAPSIQGTAQLGYPAHLVVPIGIVELACLVLCLIPRTSILGAVVLTGYLGGAVATHVRIGHPLFSHVLFPIYVAAIVWAGLWLRDPRVRALTGPRRSDVDERPDGNLRRTAAA